MTLSADKCLGTISSATGTAPEFMGILAKVAQGGALLDRVVARVKEPVKPAVSSPFPRVQQVWIQSQLLHGELYSAQVA